eukprot:238029-Chlamydomonas_euryale.AAC.8
MQVAKVPFCRVAERRHVSVPLVVCPYCMERCVVAVRTGLLCRAKGYVDTPVGNCVDPRKHVLPVSPVDPGAVSASNLGHLQAVIRRSPEITRCCPSAPAARWC